MANWHVILMIPGREAEATAGLAEVACPTVWPRWTDHFTNRGRTYPKTRSLAPGYVFVRFDGTDPLAWHDVRDACGNGFRSFIGGEYPDPISDSVMEQFMLGCLTEDGLMAAPQEARQVGRIYRPGERVALAGLLDATEGTVVWSDARGVRITVNLFARAVEMWVPRGSGVIDGTEHTVKRKAPRRRRRARSTQVYSNALSN